MNKITKVFIKKFEIINNIYWQINYNNFNLKKDSIPNKIYTTKIIENLEKIDNYIKNIREDNELLENKNEVKNKTNKKKFEKNIA